MYAPSQRPQNITRKLYENSTGEIFPISLCGVFPVCKDKRSIFFSIAKQNTCTHTKWISTTLFYILFLKPMWKKDPALAFFVFNSVAYCSMLCKRSDFYVFKQYKVNPFSALALCSNKWYSCSKAMLHSHFSSGKSIQSHYSSRSDIRDYKLSKCGEVQWHSWGGV